MQLSDLQNLVGSWLDDPNFGYFTLTQINVWLNNAQGELQKRLLKAGNNRYCEAVITPLVVGQNDYILPADFKKLHNLEIIISGTPPNESTSQVVAITENQKYLVPTGSGTPAFYTFKKNRLVLRPAPDTALNMRMIYSYQVAPLVNATDVPDAPSDYHEMIALLATEDGLIKDGRANPYIEKKIAAIQASIDSDAQERSQDGPRGIIETGQGIDTGFVW